MQPNDELTPNNQDAPAPETVVNPTLETPVEASEAPAVTPETNEPAEVNEATTPSNEPTPNQPESVTAAPVTPSQPKSKRKKLTLAAIIAGAVLLLGAGSAAAYYGLILPNRPERIVQQGIANTINQEKVQSAAFEGEVTLEGGEASKAISGLTFNGSSSKAGAMQATISLNTLVTKINLDAKSEDGKTIYLKLSGLTGLDQLLGAFAGSSESPEQTAAVASLISNVNDQWFMIDQSFLSQLGGEAANVTSSELTAEDTKKVGDIYKKHQFLTIDKKLDDQDIHGVKSYHMQASINRDQLVGFLNELKAANIQSLPVEQSLIDEVAKVDFTKYPLELWIGKKDRYLTQLATTFENEGTKYKVRIALFDFNKPVTVEKPNDAKSILELLGGIAPLAGGLSGEAQQAQDLPLLTQ